MKIKRLTLEGFRSFKDKAVFEFPDNGMILVSGYMSDGTSASSGTGKSSVVMGIAFALGFCDLPATVLKNRGSKKISVQLDLDDEGKTVTIIRDPKPKVLIDGAESSVMATDAEETIAKILKSSPDLARTLTYRAQREFGNFIHSTDSDKKEFLSKVLDLDTIELAHEQLSNQYKTLTLESDRLRADIDSLVEFVKGVSVTPEDYATATENYNQAKEAANQTDNSKIKEIADESQKYQKQISEIQSVKARIDRNEIENRNYREQMLKIKADNDKLQSCICPTCLREWDKTADLIDQNNKKIQDLALKAQTNIEFKKNSESLLESLPSLAEKYQALEAQVRSARSSASMFMANVSTAECSMRAIKKTLDEKDSKKQEAVKKMTRLKEVQAEIEELKHAVSILSRDGFLGNIFDEVLSDIESKVNTYIADIPNVHGFVFNLDSASTTKSGTVKKSISTKLIKDGEDLPLSSLSGGQKCSMELCVDLAVAEVIRQRTGSKLNWICLDEALDGLDLINKNAALEVIRNNIFGQIIVIDHATEIKEKFTKVIDVVYDGRSSFVV